MALKLWLVEGDVLDRHGPLAGLMLDHAIHQGEGIAMGQQPLDLFAREHGSLRGGFGLDAGGGAR